MVPINECLFVLQFRSKSSVIVGYDIRSEKGYEQMKAEFEEVIGRQYLKAVHLNDSKGESIFSIG